MVKVVLNESGIRDLLNSSDVQKHLLNTARQVSSRAGGGYTVDVEPGRRRAHARVETASEEAFEQELANNSLIRALGSMR